MRYLLSFFLTITWLYGLEVSSSQKIEKVNAATLNTLLIFTSQEGLSSGLYHFTNTSVAVDMKVYHLPFTYHFRSDSNINYFIVGNVGYSQIYLAGDIVKLPENTNFDYNSHIQTFTAGFGGGVRYKVTKEFLISGGLELIYSRAGLSVSLPTSDLGNKIEDFFNNNYSSNLSYKFFTLLEYKTRVKEFKPYVTFGYKLFETKSTVTFDELIRFDSQSNVTTLNVGFETPKLFESGRNNFTLETYINTNYLGGTVKEVVNFSWYQSFGLVGYYNTPLKPDWASRFFVEVNTIRSGGLEGYNLGVGFTLDF